MSSESFNASVFLVDRQVEAGHGDRIAITGPAGTLTYAQLAGHVSRFAAGLRTMGVRPEERVLLVMSDRPETAITILAVMRMGAVAVPVSTMYNPAELATLVRDSRARVVVATPEFAPAVREAVRSATDVAVLVLIDPPPAEGETPVCLWSDVLESGRAAGLPYDSWRDSPALWLYTSGTTGAPRRPCTGTAPSRTSTRGTGGRSSASAPTTGASRSRGCSSRTASATPCSSPWPRAPRRSSTRRGPPPGAWSPG